MSANVTRSEVVVTAPLEVDIATAPELSESIAHVRSLHPARVVVDFGASTFCDSAAMDVLVHAAAELRTVGCELEIRSPNRCLRLMGRVLGLSDDLGLPPV